MSWRGCTERAGVRSADVSSRRTYQACRNTLWVGAGPAGERTALTMPGRLSGECTMEVIVWRQRAPRAAFRERIAGWRARHWRRAVLAWSVLCLICVAISAEPGTAFPKAQARAVPAVGVIMKVAGG